MARVGAALSRIDPESTWETRGLRDARAERAQQEAGARGRTREGADGGTRLRVRGREDKNVFYVRAPVLSFPYRALT